MKAPKNSTPIRAETPKFSPASFVTNALIGTADLCSVCRASRATIYVWISSGLMVPAIKLGSKSSAYPASEVNAILAARIAGKSDDEIRALVIQLTEARKHCA